jgi:hypothetical protein
MRCGRYYRPSAIRTLSLDGHGVDVRGARAHAPSMFSQVPAMTGIRSHIRSLECYVERCGGCVVRESLPEAIHGGQSRDCITLHAGLDPYQQLLALVHELTHWLAHRDAPQDLSACTTIYEYEAEAVESLVMRRLGLPWPSTDAAAEEFDRPTDGLLTSSVARVRSTVRRICQALELEPDRPG